MSNKDRYLSKLDVLLMRLLSTWLGESMRRGLPVWALLQLSQGLKLNDPTRAWTKTLTGQCLHGLTTLQWEHWLRVAYSLETQNAEMQKAHVQSTCNARSSDPDADDPGWDCDAKSLSLTQGLPGPWSWPEQGLTSHDSDAGKGKKLTGADNVHTAL